MPCSCSIGSPDVDPVGRMPFYFYDIPAMTGVTIDTHEFVRRAQETLPGFAAYNIPTQTSTS